MANLTSNQQRLAFGLEASFNSAAARSTFMDFSELPSLEYDLEKVKVQGFTGSPGYDKAGFTGGNKKEEGEISCVGRATYLDMFLNSMFGYKSAGGTFSFTTSIASYTIEHQWGMNWSLFTGMTCRKISLSSEEGQALMSTTDWVGAGFTEYASTSGQTAGSAAQTEIPLMHHNLTISYSGTALTVFKFQVDIEWQTRENRGNNQQPQEFIREIRSVKGSGQVRLTGASPEKDMIANWRSNTLAAIQGQWSNGTDVLAFDMTYCDVTIKPTAGEREATLLDFEFEAHSDGTANTTQELRMTITNA